MTPIVITALICALVQAVEHWFPWRMVLKTDLPRIPAYALGVLGIIAPLSGLYIHWAQTVMPGSWYHLVALWACVASSGLAVVLCYSVDWLLDHIRASHERKELQNAKARSEQ